MANILADFQDGQNFVGGLVQGAAKRKAGTKLAQRDYEGAATDLYGAGMLKEGAGVQDMQADQEDRAREIADEERKQQEAEVSQRLGFFKQIYSALGQVPVEKRNEAFEHFAPTLQAMGLPDELISQARAAPKDDATLLAGGAKIDDELKFFSTSRGVVAANPRTGEAKLAYEAPEKPLTEEATQALIDLRRAQADRARRPPADRRSAGQPQTAARPAGRVLGVTLDPNDGW